MRILLFLSFIVPFSFAQNTTVKIEKATTSLSFNEPYLSSFGIFLSDIEATGFPQREPHLGFAAADQPSLFFDVASGDFEVFAGGSMAHRGGVVFRTPNGPVDLRGFVLRPGGEKGVLELADAHGDVWFYLGMAHQKLNLDRAQLLLTNIDMIFSLHGARAFSQPMLAGTYAGTADLEFILDIPEDLNISRGFCEPDFNGEVDVVLTGLSAVSVVSAYQEGGRVAFAPGAYLRNDGTADVSWLRSIAPDGGMTQEETGQHPYLVIHFYRLHDGVFEQLGRSDVKHAFFAVNSGCSCQGDQILFVGCEDFYGAFTNTSHVYLAPREEINPFTGAWESNGSHFDGEPVDNFRDHGGSQHHPDPFEHRLWVNEADLQTEGARYFIEAWYIVQNDINIFNSMGWREVWPSLNANWFFSYQGVTHNEGPAIDAFVPLDNEDPNRNAVRIDTGAGWVQVAGVATEIPGNLYRYSYTVMPLDYNDGFEAVSLPVAYGIQNVVFADGNYEAGDDWLVDQSDLLEITAPEGGDMKWGRGYTITFDSEIPPSESYLPLSLVPTGGGQALEVPMPMPAALCGSRTALTAQAVTWPDTTTMLQLVNFVNDVCP